MMKRPARISDADWAEFERLEAASREYGRRWRELSRKPTGVGPPRFCAACGGTSELVHV
jgi:hypothetical protein